MEEWNSEGMIKGKEENCVADESKEEINKQTKK